jgi:prepilin peptidase CpaA
MYYNGPEDSGSGALFESKESVSYLPFAVQALLTAIIVPAALFDLRWRRVPNWLTLSGLMLGIALNIFVSGRAGLVTSSAGFGLAVLVYAPLYLLRGIGAGDLKLMAAVGAIVGPGNWLVIFVFSALAGGVAALVLAAAKKRLRRTFENLWFVLARLSSVKAPHSDRPDLAVGSPEALHLPHAVVIGCGTIAFLLAHSRAGLPHSLLV